MEENKDVNVEKPKKKKHPIKTFFRVIIGLFFFVLIAAIALVIYIGVNISTTENFNGSERVQEIAGENKTTSEVGQNILFESLDSLKDSSTNDMTIALSEDNMNYLLHSAATKINLGSLKVKNMYMTYNSDTKYTIYIPCEFLFIKSCAYASCTLKYIEKTDVVDLYVEKINIGKLDTNNFIIKNFVLPNINETSIERMFKKLGLNASCSIDRNGIDIKVPSSDILAKLTNAINQESSTMFNVLYDTLNDNKKISFEFSKENIGLKASLSEAINTNPSDSIESNLSSAKTKMQTLINSKICTHSNSSIVFNYLVNGYDMLEDEEKAVVDKLDFSSVGINDVTSYNGVLTRSNDKVNFSLDFVKAAEYLAARQFVLHINEETINHEIEKNKCVGLSSAVLNMANNSFSYIVIEDINTRIHEDSLEIVILLDINSKESEMVIKLDKVSGSGKLTTSINNIKMGNLAISADKYADILKFIGDNVSLKYLSIDLDNQYIILDFKDCGNENFISLVSNYNFEPEYTLVEEKFELVYKIK